MNPASATTKTRNGKQRQKPDESKIPRMLDAVMIDGINPRFVEGNEDGSGRQHIALYADEAAEGSSKNETHPGVD